MRNANPGVVIGTYSVRQLLRRGRVTVALLSAVLNVGTGTGTV
jgi:hypothetical protein